MTKCEKYTQIATAAFAEISAIEDISERENALQELSTKLHLKSCKMMPSVRRINEYDKGYKEATDNLNTAIGEKYGWSIRLEWRLKNGITNLEDAKDGPAKELYAEQPELFDSVIRLKNKHRVASEMAHIAIKISDMINVEKAKAFDSYMMRKP